jgi:hypothetical protein
MPTIQVRLNDNTEFEQPIICWTVHFSDTAVTAWPQVATSSGQTVRLVTQSLTYLRLLGASDQEVPADLSCTQLALLRNGL